MQDFKELIVWKLAFDLNKEIYKVTAKFPKEEFYALTQQLRRASVSVSSNIAEGCGKRTNKDFISFLYNSMGSLKEIESQLLIAKDLNYLPQSKFIELDEKLDELGRKLTRFIQHVRNRDEKKEVVINA